MPVLPSCIHQNRDDSVAAAQIKNPAARTKSLFCKSCKKHGIHSETEQRRVLDQPCPVPLQVIQTFSRLQVKSSRAGFFRQPQPVQLSFPENLRLRLLRLWLPPDILSRFHYLLP